MNSLRSAICCVLSLTGLLYVNSIFGAERDYQQAWCDAHNGQMEVQVRGGRADCVTKRYAVEFDFAHKWKECIVQARWYALMTGKRPMCALIMGPGDEKYRDMMEFYLQSYEAWLRIEPIPKGGLK